MTRDDKTIWLIVFLIVLVLWVMCGCATRPDISRIPGIETATLAPVVRDASALTTTVPGDGLRLGIEPKPDHLVLTWNSNGNYTVNGSLYPDGPWSAITNASSPVAIPYPAPLENYGSNRFYRLSQSNVKLDRYWMGAGVPIAAPVGNNDIAIASADFHWSQQDYLFVLTNGYFAGFPLTAPGLTPCAPLAMALDTDIWRLFTVESECFHGWGTGPYKLWTWQLVGEGIFNDAQPIASETFGGQLGTTWGDMIRLRSGAIIAVWKDPDSTKNYCFRYRTPAGQWQPIWCASNVEQRSSTAKLAQHPNGTIFCFITRDGLHPIPTVVFREANNNLVHISTLQSPMHQEGEWSKVTAEADPANNRLIVTRTADPHIFVRAGEAWLTVKGSCIRSAYWYSETNLVESPTFPASWTNTAGGSLDGPKHPVNHQEVFIFSEPINNHATALVGGKLWLIKQEFNPQESRFNNVYAQTLENNVWGERHYLYRAADCNNCRGLASNWLVGFHNSDPNPSRILFSNLDENGEATLFELTP